MYVRFSTEEDGLKKEMNNNNSRLITIKRESEISEVGSITLKEEPKNRKIKKQVSNNI